MFESHLNRCRICPATPRVANQPLVIQVVLLARGESLFERTAGRKFRDTRNLAAGGVVFNGYDFKHCLFTGNRAATQRLADRHGWKSLRMHGANHWTGKRGDTTTLREPDPFFFSSMRYTSSADSQNLRPSRKVDSFHVSWGGPVLANV